MLDLHLFQDRLFAFAALAGGLNGLARGAVLFVLIFFLQGPYGQNPLTAGLMMTPFGAAFLFLGPFAGYLSDHYGSRLLATAGLLISAVGLLGLSTVVATTPYWLLAAYMALMGGGSGLFTSPNVNALMSTVPPRQRGTASGINTMVANTGQMLSIAIAFPLVLSRIPEDVMFKVFLYGGGMGDVPDARMPSSRVCTRRSWCQSASRWWRRWPQPCARRTALVKPPRRLRVAERSRGRLVTDGSPVDGASRTVVRHVAADGSHRRT
jgi:MFS family permease